MGLKRNQKEKLYQFWWLGLTDIEKFETFFMTKAERKALVSQWWAERKAKLKADKADNLANLVKTANAKIDSELEDGNSLEQDL